MWAGRMNWNDLSDFDGLVQHLCKRPAMYAGSTDFREAATWLVTFDAGVAFGKNRRGLHLGEWFLRYFYDYLADKYKTAHLRAWWEVIQDRAKERHLSPFLVLANEFAAFKLENSPPLV